MLTYLGFEACQSSVAVALEFKSKRYTKYLTDLAFLGPNCKLWTSFFRSKNTQSVTYSTALELG